MAFLPPVSGELTRTTGRNDGEDGTDEDRPGTRSGRFFMFDKLIAIETRYEQLMAEMADPRSRGDTAKFRSTRRRWPKSSRSSSIPAIQGGRRTDRRHRRSCSRIPTCASWRRRS